MTRQIQLLKSSDLGRHSLLYLKEIGQGWFGKVLLGEVNSGLSSTQVVVKELKVSASVQDQMQFLEEAQPYRALQHPNLLQCLAQCAEVTPYLLVMEFCPMGDLKSYLRSCCADDPMALDPLTLQRMACEISSGLMHLHKNNYVHSDLALRNCLLTADLTVKIGDYGLSHSKYKEDYFVTADQLWVPLRWTAPELIDEVHGNLLVVDQTKASNIWSLGVTVWELFELGSQPYHHYSDKQVLTYAIKEEQLKLPRPQLQLSLSDRWYEVMQFCWLQAEQRPTAEEVHLLLSYLCVKGTTEAEEEFEKRWNSLKPHGSASHHGARASSYPLLAHFSGDAFHTDGDDILTVTETSRGLNFEYKWEPAKPEHFQVAGGALSPSNAHYQDMYCQARSAGRLSLGVSPTCYEYKSDCQSLQTPGVVPVLSAHSPSVSSEYYIRIEEPSDCHADLDYTMCSYSPEYNRISPTKGPSWQEKDDRGHLYDSDNSPTVSLTMEPLLGQDPPPSDAWENTGCYPDHKCRSKDVTHYEPQSSDGTDECLLEASAEAKDGCKVPGCKKSLFEDPLGVSPSLNCLYRDTISSSTYVDRNDESFPEKLIELTRRKLAIGRCQVKSPFTDSVIVELEDEGVYESPEPADDVCQSALFSEEAHGLRWNSNSSSNNNISSCCPPRPPGDSIGADAWCNRRATQCRGAVTEPFGPESWQSTDLEDTICEESSSSVSHHRSTMDRCPRADCCFEVQLGEEYKDLSDASRSISRGTEFCDCPGSNDLNGKELLPEPALSHEAHQDALGLLLCDIPQETACSDYPIVNKPTNVTGSECCTVPMDSLSTEAQDSSNLAGSCSTHEVTCPFLNTELQLERNSAISFDAVEQLDCSNEENAQIEVEQPLKAIANSPGDLPAEAFQTFISEPDGTFSSISFNETDNCSDDEDTTELTSGIFMDFSSDYPERADTAPSFRSLQKQVGGTPDSLESLDIPSVSSSCDVYSPMSYNPCSQPRALDSGYDTENYESPEFVLKEPHEPHEEEAFSQVTKSSSSLTLADVEGSASDMHRSSSFSSELHALDAKNPYRDSAYFSDFDADLDKNVKEEDEVAEELELDVKQEEPPEFKTAQCLEESHFSEGTAEETKIASFIPEEVTLVSSLDCSETRSLSPAVEKIVPVIFEGKIPVFSLSVGDGGMEILLSQSLAAKAESLDEGLGLECSKAVSTDLDLSSGDTMHTLPPRTFLLTHVDQHKEGQCLNGLKESGVQHLDGVLHDVESSAGHKDKLVPSQRFKVKISTMPGQDLSPFNSHHPTEVEGLQECQGDPAISRGQLSQLSLDLSLMHGKKETRQGPSDRVEDVDEDEDDTEDSDESDEELCCYNIQEPSEDSEEEPSVAPVVIAESQSSRNLRSLLKIPALLTHSFCKDFEHKKKMVSFFDDVTVYLFDQESPTKDLGEEEFPVASPPDLCTDAASSLDRLNISDDLSDGNVSEESGGFEWDDDFRLMPVTTPFVPSLTSVNSALVPSMPQQKQVLPIHFSRFTVSPAAVSRFSITHVSDSDMDSAGGSSEDGERE